MLGDVPDQHGGDHKRAAADPQDPPTFIPHGQIYGAPASASQVVLQARKSISLVVRRPDGSVFFAQVLQAGEAYRAPMTGSMSVDVPAFQDVRVYVAGQLHAPLAAELTAVAKLAPAPAPVSSTLASGAPAATVAAGPSVKPAATSQVAAAPKAPTPAKTAPKTTAAKPASSTAPADEG